MDGIDVDRFARLVGGTLAGRRPPSGATVEHVSVHSERIPVNAAFFALRGQRADGHQFVDEALANGAVVAVVAAGRPPAAGDGPVLVVADPLRALQRLAAWWRSQMAARVVAVVGSNGKTITKDALVHFAGFSARTIGSPGSYNSQLGVPLAILGFPRNAEVAVVEAAVSQPGEMEALEDVVRPDHVVVTNLGLRWQGHFADRRHRAAELLRMAHRVGPGGWVLLGDEDPDLVAAAAVVDAVPVHRYNRSAGLPSFDVEARRRSQTVLSVRFPDGTAGRVGIHAPSDEISTDVGVAMTAAWLLGTPADALLSAAEQYRPTSTRVETWRAPANYTVVRDVATPDPLAVSSALRAGRRNVVNGGRMIAVLAEPPVPVDPTVLAGLAQVIVSEDVDVVLGVSGPQLRRVASEIEASGVPIHVTLFDSTRELRAQLLRMLAPGDVVLVQSGPSALIDDAAALLIESVASPRVYFDVGAVEHNVRTFRGLVGSSVRIMAMVKALAYGTDPVPVSLALQAAGVDQLGVAKADEGIDLRRAGIALPVVVFDPSRELDKIVRYQLTPVLHSPELVEAVCGRKPDGGPLEVHLEVDTGMHRTGLPPESAAEALGELRAADGVRLVGVMTHFAAAEDPAADALTQRQLERFREVMAAVRAAGWTDVSFHAANTAATLRHPGAHLDMVRLGLGLHGLYPSEACRAVADLVPALGLVSRLVDVRRLEGGERIGYGWTYTVPAGGGVYGTVNCGYGDGVPRSASNRAWVRVGGCRCPIVGMLSMDSMTVDLSCCPDAAVGDEVLVYGRHGDGVVPLEEFSALAGTIAYEPMTRIGPRVQRIFTGH